MEESFYDKLSKSGKENIDSLPIRLRVNWYRWEWAMLQLEVGGVRLPYLGTADNFSADHQSAAKINNGRCWCSLCHLKHQATYDLWKYYFLDLQDIPTSPKDPERDADGWDTLERNSISPWFNLRDDWKSRVWDQIRYDYQELQQWDTMDEILKQVETGDTKATEDIESAIAMAVADKGYEVDTSFDTEPSQRENKEED